MSCPDTPRSVVVTGASTGIGAATARHLAGLGWRVFAGVRTPADGDGLRGIGVTPVLIDVTDPTSLAEAAASVEEVVGGSGLHGLHNNAGIAVAGPVELVRLEDWRRQLEVNVIGQVAATQAFLPLVRRARGRVVFTSSLSGVFSPPFLGPYAASKHAVEAIADSLRREVGRSGVRVALVQPGAVATPIWQKGLDEAEALRAQFGARGEELYPGMTEMLVAETERNQKVAIDPAKVAAVVEHALTARRPRHRYVVGTDARVITALDGLLPSPVLDRVVARMLG